MKRSLASRFDPEAGPKRILALDGGGVKGILTLGMLEALEAELRRRSGDPELVLSDYYDLIGGTSTGAIIATGLALGNSVAFMIDKYRTMIPAVFGQRRSNGITGAKFDHKALRKVLSEVIGRRTLGTPDLACGLAIHAKRIDTGSAWVLTNNPNAKFFDPPNPDKGTVPNKKYRLVDLVQASAAAPTFFDEVKIPIAYTEDDRKVAEYGYFVDGAVSANNNPSIQLLLLALIPSYGFKWRPGADRLMLTSFGTGQRRPTVDGARFQSKLPALRGVASLAAMIFDTQMQGIMVLQALSEPKRPWKVNSEIGDMAGERLTEQMLLDFQRIDALLDTKKPGRGGKKKPGEPQTEVEAHLGRAISPDLLEGLDEMDNGAAQSIDLLLELGRAVGPKFIGAAYPDPKFDLPHWAKASAPAA